jgi:hypothetical protein
MCSIEDQFAQFRDEVVVVLEQLRVAQQRPPEDRDARPPAGIEDDDRQLAVAVLAGEDLVAVVVEDRPAVLGPDAVLHVRR